MSTTDTCCSIVPYFNVSDENLLRFRELTEQFVAKTQGEDKVLYYGFCFNGNSVHCREGYRDAEGALAHLENIGDILAEALKISTIDRLEIHGPESELAKMRGPLTDLNPSYYVLENGFRR